LANTVNERFLRSTSAFAINISYGARKHIDRAFKDFQSDYDIDLLGGGDEDVDGTASLAVGTRQDAVDDAAIAGNAAFSLLVCVNRWDIPERLLDFRDFVDDLTHLGDGLCGADDDDAAATDEFEDEDEVDRNTDLEAERTRSFCCRATVLLLRLMIGYVLLFGLKVLDGVYVCIKTVILFGYLACSAFTRRRKMAQLIDDPPKGFTADQSRHISERSALRLFIKDDDDDDADDHEDACDPDFMRRKLSRVDRRMHSLSPRDELCLLVGLFSLFDRGVREVFNLMESDLLPRFKHAPAYYRLRAMRAPRAMRKAERAFVKRIQNAFEAGDSRDIV
jgi:hypothetical protein